MKRFVIRNYGASIQVPYKGCNVTFTRDSIIETDDSGLAVVIREFTKQDGVNLCVTDRGSHLVANPPVTDESKDIKNHDDRVPTASLETPDAPIDKNEEGVKDVETKEPEPDEEISYSDMTIPELKELAKDRDVDVKGMNKAKIVKALEDFDKAGRPSIVKH